MTHPTKVELDRVINHILGERMPNRPKQGIELVSQVQNYRCGARMQLGAKVYHYGMANGILGPQMGAKVQYEQEVSQQIIGANAAAGVSLITITLANTDGPTFDGLMPANYLEGGTVYVFGALGDFNRGILSNTAVLVNAGTATFNVVLDAPTPVAITVADIAEAMASVYRSMVPFGDCHIGQTWMTVAGIPTMATVAGDWSWVQTWGPCFVAPAAEVGDAAED
ncbi:unnamed protein product, partial [marine sediment metagenome]